MNHHFDPRWVDGGWWWLGGVVPLVMLLLLSGLVVWGVVRLSRMGPTPGAAAPVPPAPPAPARDPALEEVRLRYARGEISREEFLERSQDLGGIPADTAGETGHPTG